MLVKEFPITGESTVNTIDVPTVYRYVTVFNNSSHEIAFLPDTDRDSRFIHFAVSPFQYVTYPLDMMGTVASCKRSQTFTINSIRRIVTPPFPIQFPNIRLLFSEENFNVNNYQQTNALVNVSLPPTAPLNNRRLFTATASAASGVLILFTATTNTLITSIIFANIGIGAASIRMSIGVGSVGTVLLPDVAIPTQSILTMPTIGLDVGNILIINNVTGHVQISGFGST